jgi:hypothetical protein
LFAVVDNLRRVSFSGKQQRQAVAAFLGNRVMVREIGMRMLLANNSLCRAAEAGQDASSPRACLATTHDEVCSSAM